jgi:hypothetical protein
MELILKTPFSLQDKNWLEALFDQIHSLLSQIVFQLTGYSSGARKFVIFLLGIYPQKNV